MTSLGSPPDVQQLYLLNLPPFLGLNHKNFDYTNYKAPTQSHDKIKGVEDTEFSAYSTATTTLHWRRDPKTPEMLQSNARIVRWSDGSLTVQLASAPKDHYRIATTALKQSYGKKHNQLPTEYDPSKDSQTYLAAPHLVQGVDLQIMAPFDAAMRVLPTGDQADESILKLQQSLAASAQTHDPLLALKQIKEDPELAKKTAELFDKDRLRLIRKREAAEERNLVRKDRVLGRSGGYGRGGGTGLSVAGLEDEDGMPTARGTKGSRIKKRPYNRRGDIYSDDEDETMPRGRTREDEYDREDDFLAASDEEPETYEDDDEEEEEEEEVEAEDDDVDDPEIEGRETVIQERTRAGPDRSREKGKSRGKDSTPKRALSEDDDAAGEDDVTPGAPGSPQARKKRRVIDDDEDDE